MIGLKMTFFIIRLLNQIASFCAKVSFNKKLCFN